MNKNVQSLDDLKGLRCCLYCRCSTEEESQVNALAMQVNISREKARQLGLTVVAEYVESVSGTSTEHRTEYNRMMQDMTSNKWDVIVIKCEDRLNRNELDWFIFQQKLIENGKTLYMWLNNTIYNTDTDRFIVGIKAIMNREFSKNLSVKGHAAHKFRQLNHTALNFPSGIYGWTKIDKVTYEINEEQAKFIRMAVQLLLQGASLHRIAKELNANGAVGLNGGYIYPCNWKAIMRSERLYGTVISNKYQVDFDKHKKVETTKDKWIVWDNALPAIIDKETWDRVQDILDRKEEKSHSGWKISGKYPLSSKMYCGLCGSVMHRQKYYRDIQTTNTNKQYTDIIWVCRHRQRFGIKGHENSCSMQLVNEKLFYPSLLDNAKKYFGQLFTSKDNIIELSLEIIAKVLKAMNNGENPESIKEKINKQKKKRQRLLDKLLDETISDADFKQKDEELKEQINSLQAQVESIESNNSGLVENERKLKEIRSLLETSELIEFANVDVVLSLVDKIVLNADSSMTVMFDKHKVFDMLGLDIIPSLSNELGELVMTMQYNGWQVQRERVDGGALELFKIVKEHPDWSYKQYADKLGWAVEMVSSRFRVLRNKGYCVRDKRSSPWTILKND